MVRISQERIESWFEWFNKRVVQALYSFLNVEEREWWWWLHSNSLKRVRFTWKSALVAGLLDTSLQMNPNNLKNSWLFFPWFKRLLLFSSIYLMNSSFYSFVPVCVIYWEICCIAFCDNIWTNLPADQREHRSYSALSRISPERLSIKKSSNILLKCS